MPRNGPSLATPTRTVADPAPHRWFGTASPGGSGLHEHTARKESHASVDQGQPGWEDPFEEEDAFERCRVGKGGSEEIRAFEPLTDRTQQARREEDHALMAAAAAAPQACSRSVAADQGETCIARYCRSQSSRCSMRSSSAITSRRLSSRRNSIPDQP